MMIKIKLNCSSFAGKLHDGDYEIPEGTTIKVLLDSIHHETSYALTHDDLNSLIFIYNNKPVSLNDALYASGDLYVLSGIAGG